LSAPDAGLSHRQTAMTNGSNTMTESAAAKLHRWEDLPHEQLNESIGRRLITGSNTMIAQIYLKKGGIVPMHSHHNEQITYVLEGALKFLLGKDQDEEVIVRSGEVLTIPPHLPHSAEALEDTLDVDVFNPPRQDWLDGTDDYLRR
jgi:quercetin dioxygenase-like cupin family protein